MEKKETFYGRYEDSTLLQGIMGTEEAAEKWGLSNGYVKNLCNKGVIQARKIGPTWILDINTPNPKQS